MTDNAWICLYADAEPPGPAPHTLLVDDLDRFLAEVAGRGIVPGPVERIAPSVRQSVITDPDGNRLKVGQAADRAAEAPAARAAPARRRVGHRPSETDRRARSRPPAATAGPRSVL